MQSKKDNQDNLFCMRKRPWKTKLWKTFKKQIKIDQKHVQKTKCNYCKTLYKTNEEKIRQYPPNIINKTKSVDCKIHFKKENNMKKHHKFSWKNIQIIKLREKRKIDELSFCENCEIFIKKLWSTRKNTNRWKAIDKHFSWVKNKIIIIIVTQSCWKWRMRSQY